jgi:hypothetical protein
MAGSVGLSGLWHEKSLLMTMINQETAYHAGIAQYKKQSAFLLIGLVAVLIIGGGQFYYLLVMSKALIHGQGVGLQFRLIFPVFFFIFTLLTLARYWILQ